MNLEFNKINGLSINFRHMYIGFNDDHGHFYIIMKRDMTKKDLENWKENLENIKNIEDPEKHNLMKFLGIK